MNDQDLRVSINVSQDFEPGAETIGDYILRKAELLKKLGEQLNKTDSCSVEMEVENLGLGKELEITGSY